MIECQYAILCEDIRRELGNKLSLMGLYGPEIILNDDTPVEIDLSFFMMLENVPKGDNEFYVKISGPGQQAAFLKTSIGNHEDSPVGSIASPSMRILIEQEGDLVIEVGETRENLREVVRTRVREYEEDS